MTETAGHPHEELQIGCLISGGGRTVLNLAEIVERDAIPARIGIVIAHRETIPGVARCRDAGLPVTIVPIEDSVDADDRIDRALDDAGVRLVCLAGYLRHFRVGPRWTDQVINIHPSLLPRHGGHGMYGDRVHRAVLDSDDTVSGCTVHAVDEIYDHGVVIHQRTCPVLPGDDVDSLASRVFAEECQALPEVVSALSRGVLSIDRGQVRGTVPSHC